MKKLFFAVSAVVIMASCSQNNPRPEAETKTLTPVDTAGLAQFQAWKAQNELAVAQQQVAAEEEPVKEVVRERVVYVNEPRRTTRSRSTRSSSGTASNSNGSTGSAGAGTSAGTETAPAEEKKGMSKSAKGAIIGGAGGAVAGAVINKRNRAVGAVIGGVVGGAVGYGIGKSKDKKDGRN